MRGASSCQYALALFRWLDRAPDEFVRGGTGSACVGRLPTAGPDHRLRWDLAALHAALDAERRARELTWAALGRELDCTAGRLTNLRTAKHADLALVMSVTQWLDRPSTDFIHPTTW